MQSFLTSWYGKDRDGTGRLLNLRLARGLRNARAPLFLPSEIEAVAPEIGRCFRPFFRVLPGFLLDHV